MNVAGHFVLSDQKLEAVAKIFQLNACLDEFNHDSHVICLILSAEHELERRFEIFRSDIGFQELQDHGLILGEVPDSQRLRHEPVIFERKSHFCDFNRKSLVVRKILF